MSHDKQGGERGNFWTDKAIGETISVWLFMMLLDDEVHVRWDLLKVFDQSAGFEWVLFKIKNFGIGKVGSFGFKFRQT